MFSGNCIKVIRYFLIWFIPLSAFAQNSGFDEEENSFWYYSDRDQLHRFDTSLINFEEYNFIQRKGIEYKNLGNLGSSHYPLQLKLQRQPGFESGLLNNVELYRMEWDSMKLYNLLTPFAELRYILGLNSESMFSAEHGQRVSRDFDYGVEFLRINSEGIFKRQTNLHNAFTIYLRFRTKNRRYQIMGRSLMNDLEMLENGGMANNIFDTAEAIVSKSILEVKLNDAVTNIDEFALGLEQSFSLGFEKEKMLDSVMIKEWMPTIVFGYDIAARRTKFRYRDNNIDSAYYSDFNILVDSIEFRQRHTKISQEFSIKSTGLSRDGNEVTTIPFIFKAAARYNIHTVTQRVERDYHNLGFSGLISSNENDKSSLIYKASANLIVSGYNSGDLSISGQAGYNFGKAGIIESSVLLNQKEPSYIHERFESEISWTNDFKKVRSFNVEFLYKLKRHGLNLSVNYYNIGNYIYYSTDAKPEQLDGDLNVIALKFRKDLTIWNRFHIDNKLTFQLYSEEVAVISKPEFYGEHSIYYLGPLFNKALEAMIGIDFRFNSTYYLPSYFPVAGIFYAQTKEESDYYAAVDVFVNMAVKSLRLFFKVNNTTHGIFHKGYYSAIYYPYDERSFRFGVNWRFLD